MTILETPGASSIVRGQPDWLLYLNSLADLAGRSGATRFSSQTRTSPTARRVQLRII